MVIPELDFSMLFNSFIHNPLKGTIFIIFASYFIYKIFPAIDGFLDWTVKMKEKQNNETRH